MASAGEKAGVGPMAAVAGAIAEHVGIDLLGHTHEVVVENGGDVFFKTNGPVTIGIFAGNSPVSLGMGLRVYPGKKPLSVCTSSGTVGHSLSFGKSGCGLCVVPLRFTCRCRCNVHRQSDNVKSAYRVCN